jgi:hypothetical protein
MAADNYTVPRLHEADIRRERLQLAHTMLQLLVSDAATMPLPQQLHLRTATKSVQAVQEWCKHHGRGGGG